MPDLDVVVIGGGAAGFFTAITCAEANPKLKVTIFERGTRVLSKVLVSGGGRCNVTNSCFEPNLLIKGYPRGSTELLGPFHRFSSRDTVEWFENRGVKIKTEPDGRMFPVTDKSQTILEALTQAAANAGIKTVVNSTISTVEKTVSGFFLTFSNGEKISCKYLVLASGNGRQGYEWAQALGHSIETPVPSLFTFTISDARLKDLSGAAVEKAEVSIEETKLRQVGPVLITHWGLSGPAVLKLSAWGARILNEKNYQAWIRVNWLCLKEEEAKARLESYRKSNPKKSIGASFPFGIPRRLWERLAASTGLGGSQIWANLSNTQIKHLSEELTAGRYEVKGKGEFKEEFVTCGGVKLSEVNFKTMESKICPNLYIAGEILDIDGITGGFNFQSAWTTGFIAGEAIGKK